MTKRKVVLVTQETINDEKCVGYAFKNVYLDEKVDGSDNYEWEENERLFTHTFIMDTMRKLMGKTLTIVDASVANKAQNKAMKDLIRASYSEEMNFAAEWGFDQDVIVPMAEANAPEDILVGGKPITVEQALGVEEID